MSSIAETAPTLSQRAQECAKPSQSPLWDIYQDQWHPESNLQGFVNVGVAENTLMHNELESFVRDSTNVPTSAFTYGNGPLGSKRLKSAVAHFLNRRLMPVVPLEPDHVIITNGVSHSIEHTSWAFCDPGDGYLLGRPHYRAFIPDISLRPGVEVLSVAFGDVDPMSVEAVSAYEETLLAARARGVRAKALMLCSPHNPLGRCYSTETLVAYLRLCQKYRIHLVSDEIYTFTTWKNHHDKSPAPVDFTSVLSIRLDGVIDPSLVHVLWGMSKDFGANGLRVGYIISQRNQAFHKAVLEVAIYSYASSVAEHVAANILENDKWVDNYIQQNQQRLSDSYSFVVGLLNKHQIRYAPGANAAFFVWLDLGEAFLDRHPERGSESNAEISAEILQRLMKNKVFLGKGSQFGAETEGLFRIVFTHPRAYIEEGFNRILAAIGDDVHGPTA
jgi:1-aminocyclopropane-1-carboxylate synthase